MSSTTEQNASPPEPPPVPIRWRSWPLRDDMPRSSAVLAGLLAAGLLAGWLSGRAYLALLAMAALAAALWRVLLPVDFELNNEGVHQWVFGRYRRIPWRAVGRYEICRTGILLLPQPDDTALASFRGLYLPFQGHREEILVQIRHHLEQRKETTQ